MGAFVDLTGNRIGRLLLKEVVREKGKKLKYKCVCDCGKEKTVNASDLRLLRTMSCGCLKQEKIKEANFKHGEVGTRIYRIWSNMRNRCNCPTTTNYQFWGGKGVSVCEEWDDFLSFKKWALSSGYSDELSIDRINFEGNYTPENCRWADRVTQNTNRSNTVFIDVDGNTNSIAEWARLSGIKYGTISSWHKRGKSKREIANRIREVI